LLHGTEMPKGGKGTIWYRRFGPGDLALSCFGAELFWPWAVLAQGRFGASAHLLEYYHAHVVASRTVSSILARVFLKKQQCAFAFVLRSDWVYVRILGLKRNEVLFLEPIRLMVESLLSKRDKPQFSHDGYLYICDKCSRSDPSLLFWRCELKKRM